MNKYSNKIKTNNLLLIIILTKSVEKHSNTKKLLKKNRLNKIKSGSFFISSKYKTIKFQNKNNKTLFLPTSRVQIVSIGTSLIPFLEHNDANRALMGSNMQRQAVPLIIKQKPIISTGLESIVIYNNEYNTISTSNGLVKYSSIKRIIIHEKIKTESKLDKNYNKLSQTFLEKKRKKIKVNKYNRFIKITYKLKQKRCTIQSTNLYEENSIKKNEWIINKQILTDGASTHKGKLCLGKNLLVAYMPWKGYNFEDSIVINETVIKNDVLTSIHIKKYKTFLINNETGEVNYKWNKIIKYTS